jgi:hypothetical protein
MNFIYLYSQCDSALFSESNACNIHLFSNCRKADQSHTEQLLVLDIYVPKPTQVQRISFLFWGMIGQYALHGNDSHRSSVIFRCK